MHDARAADDQIEIVLRIVDAGHEITEFVEHRLRRRRRGAEWENARGQPFHAWSHRPEAAVHGAARRRSGFRRSGWPRLPGGLWLRRRLLNGLLSRDLGPLV